MRLAFSKVRSCFSNQIIFYKSYKTVHVLLLVDRCVKVRVCKQGRVLRYDLIYKSNRGLFITLR